MIITPRIEGYKLLHEGILAFAEAERSGIRIDMKYCERIQSKLDKKIEHEQFLFKETKFYRHWKQIYGSHMNPDSTFQLGHILYDVRKLEPPKKTNKSDKGSTDDETLLQLGIKDLDHFIRIRKIRGQKNHLTGFMREAINGYMHPFFNLHTVRTFRGSSDRPNFQNIPKRDEESMRICRRAIVPPSGYLILEADFKGMEVRVGACYHHDPNMMTYIVDPSTDMHRDMAKDIFLMDRYGITFDKKIHGHDTLRQAAKNGFVFPQFYGDYYLGCAPNLAIRWGKLTKGKWKPGQGILVQEGLHLSDLLIHNGIKTFDQFTEHLKKVEKHFWGTRFRVYQQWKEEWWEDYQEKGHFDTFTGFRCGGIMSRNDAINYPVQGSAFHCLLWVFIQVMKISKRDKWKSKLVGQIHDSMVLYVHPKELKMVYETIENLVTESLVKHWKWICVPMEIEFEKAEVDEPWSEKKEFKLAA